MNPKKNWFYPSFVNERKSEEAVRASRKRDGNWRALARIADRAARAGRKVTR